MYALGDGTFDVSLLSIEDGVLASWLLPDTRVGGEDFDDRVMDHLIKQYGTDVSKNRRAIRRLKREAEKGQTDTLEPAKHWHYDRELGRWQ